MTKNKFKNPRKHKARTQNISIREINYHSNLKREYIVSGTTNNYKVFISTNPICTCPDYKNRNVRCKHIYFVLCKILKVEDYQEDLETFKNSEVEYMLDHRIVQKKAEDYDNNKTETIEQTEVEQSNSKPGFFARWFKWIK